MAEGWIKLHRVLKEKPIWKCSTPEQKVILVTLLLMANSKESEWEWQGNKFKVKPGQFITSLKSIVEESGQGISIQNVRTALVKFETYEFLTSQSTNKNRLITIKNWELYQSREKNQQADQQAPNKQLTTNKNDKNYKNIYIDHFDTFWSSYPRKVSKSAALKAFSKLKVDGELLSLMLSALETQKNSKQWQDKQFIPHPTTWLTQRRWEDEETQETEERISMTVDGTFRI